MADIIITNGIVVTMDPQRRVIENGAVAVPTGPGLGIELDEDALARLHQQYLDCGIRDRDDTGYRQSLEPDFVNSSPRW